MDEAIRIACSRLHMCSIDSYDIELAMKTAATLLAQVEDSAD